MWMIAAIVLAFIALISIISNSVKSDLISTLRYENAHLKNYIQAYINKK
ncbi:DUF1514 family protein [Staphylococcus xylosus]|nr:DUF1514 family protein [Staphylococcus xylosus]